MTIIRHTVPSYIFRSSEQGAAYDVQRLDTLWADTSGTTPAALEGLVARLDDLSGNGNHATQATEAHRPRLSRRVNLLLDTEAPATQSVTTIAADYRLLIEGSGSVTLSGTGSGGYSAGSHVVACTAGTLTLTVSGSPDRFDLRLAADPAYLPSYQRVTTSSDYDTDGFPAYLDFDGVDDRLTTGNVDMTHTQRQQAGFSAFHFSRSATSIFLRSGTSSARFNLDTNSAGTAIRANFVGTSVNPISSLADSGFPARPVVLGVRVDTTDDMIEITVNGDAGTVSSPADMADEYFSNTPILIGTTTTATARMRFYRAMVVDRLLTESEATALAQWLNNTAGAY